MKIFGACIQNAEKQTPNVALKLNTSDHRGSETPDKLGEEEQKQK